MHASYAGGGFGTGYEKRLGLASIGVQAVSTIYFKGSHSNPERLLFSQCQQRNPPDFSCCSDHTGVTEIAAERQSCSTCMQLAALAAAIPVAFS